MTGTSHKRSVHIDAPVEQVFEHVKDHQNRIDAYGMTGRKTITEEKIAPDAGKGSTWKWRRRMLIISRHGTMRREAYVPNERIVDHSTSGNRYTFTVEPGETGTTLTMEVEVTSKVPFLDKIKDKVGWKGDKDVDTWLGNFKKAIEA